MSEIAEVTESTFSREVLESDIPVVVDFWAPWCGPCRMLAPLIEELSREFEGRVKFVKVNTDSEVALAARYGIRSIPTLKGFRRGREVVSIIGFWPEGHLRKKISVLL